jgi:hypothetical protein
MHAADFSSMGIGKGCTVMNINLIVQLLELYMKKEMCKSEKIAYRKS